MQSSRLALPQRLHALAQLLNSIDHTIATGQIPPASTLLAPVRAITMPTTPKLPPVASSTATEAGADPHPPLTEDEIMELLGEIRSVVDQQLLPRLQRYQLRMSHVDELTEAQLERLSAYFHEQIYPVLTPLAVDPAHPFPRVVPGRLYLLVTLQNAVSPLQQCRMAPQIATTVPATACAEWLGAPDPAMGSAGSREVYGLVKVIDRGPRLIALKSERPQQASPETVLCWREEIVQHFVSTLFAATQVTGTYQFRVVCSDGAADRLPAATHGPVQNGGLQEQPLRIRQPAVARIFVERGMPAHLVQWLVTHLHTSADHVCYCPPPLEMTAFSELADYLTLAR
ncbi:MAG: hypothetical protein KDE19_07600 [Caldilineaceae bacterium]|nr:hypothetical protein [Caldilineaceae bacterium]